MADYYIDLGDGVSCYQLEDHGKVFLNLAASAYIDLTQYSNVYQADVLQKLAEKGLDQHSSFIPYFKKDGVAVEADAFHNANEEYGFGIMRQTHFGSIIDVKDTAFKGCNQIEDIQLDRVLSIGNGSFADCGHLKNVYIGKDIKYISTNAFETTDPFAQQSIQSLTIDSSPSKIQKYRQHYPFGLNPATASEVIHIDDDPPPGPSEGELSVAAGVEKHVLYDDGQAYWNEALSTVLDLTQYDELTYENVRPLPSKQFIAMFSSSLSTIGEDVFLASNICKASLPSTLLSVGDDAFNNCTKLSIILEGSCLKHVGAHSFYNVLVSEASFTQLTSIGNYAFADTSFKTMSFDGEVKGIGINALQSKENDAKVHFNDMYIQQLKLMQNWPFGLQAQNIFAKQPESLVQTIQLTSSTLDIQAVRREAWKSLTEPSSLTSFSVSTSCRSISQNAFSECTNVTSAFFIDRNIKQINALGAVPFGLASESYIFPGAENPDQYTLFLHNNVIDNETVYSTMLQQGLVQDDVLSIVLDYRCLSVLDGAFDGLDNAEYAEVQSTNLMYAGSSAFSSTSLPSLTALHFKDLEAYTARSLPGYPFGAANGILTYGSSSFADDVVWLTAETITKEEVDKAAADSIYDVNNLPGFALASTCRRIETKAFASFDAVDIYLNNQLTSIAADAFSNGNYVAIGKTEEQLAAMSGYPFGLDLGNIGTPDQILDLSRYVILTQSIVQQECEVQGVDEYSVSIGIKFHDNLAQLGPDCFSVDALHEKEIFTLDLPASVKKIGKNAFGCKIVGPFQQRTLYIYYLYCFADEIDQQRFFPIYTRLQNMKNVKADELKYFSSNAIFPSLSNITRAQTPMIQESNVEVLRFYAPKLESLDRDILPYDGLLDTIEIEAAVSNSNCDFAYIYNVSYLRAPMLLSSFCPLSRYLPAIQFPLLKYIEGYAYMQNLLSVQLPEVTVVGDKAFSYCKKLAYVYLPEAEYIGEDAFYGCSSLAYVEIKNNQNINVIKSQPNYPWGISDDNVFVVKSEVPYSIVLSDDTVTKSHVDNWISTFNPFKETISSLQIQQSCRHIAPGAFEGFTGLSSVVVPRTVESLGLNTFYGCSSLTSLQFEGRTWSQVLEVPGYPFGVKVKSIKANGSMPTEQTPLVLADNVSLQTVHDGEGRLYMDASENAALDVIGLSSIDEETIDSQLAEKNLCRHTGFGIYACFSEDARRIEDRAFAELSNIQSLAFITDENCVSSMQADSFKNCTIHRKVCFNEWNMHDIAIDDAYPFGLADDTCLTATDMADVVVIDEDIGAETPYTGLSSATFALIRKSCNIVSGFYSSYDFHLKHRDGRFTNNTWLSTLVCKYNCFFGEYAFYGCDSLTKIDLPEVQYLGMPTTCPSDTSILGNGYYAFSTGNYLTGSKISSISLPKCKIIGEHTFGRLGSLVSAYIPSAVLVQEYSFSECINLSSIEAPQLTCIGSYAFYGMSALQSIDFQNVVKFDGIGQFCKSYYSDNRLTSVNLPKIAYLPADAFFGNKNLSAIFSPNLTAIGADAFARTSFKTFDFSNIYTLESRAFSGCSNLVSASLDKVTFKDIDASQTDRQFYDCYNLTSICLPAAEVIPSNICGKCSSLQIAEYDVEKIQAYGSRPFDSSSPYAQSITSLQLDNVLSVEYEAFSCFKNLKTISLKNVKNIQSRAFAETSLSSFTANRSLTSIAQDSFYYDYQSAEFYYPNAFLLEDLSADPANPEYFSDVNGIHYPALFKYVDKNNHSKGFQLYIGSNNLTSLPEGAIGFFYDEMHSTGIQGIWNVSAFYVPSTFLSGQFKGYNNDDFYFFAQAEYLSVSPECTSYTSMDGCNVIVDSTSALAVGCSNSYLCGDINTINSGAFACNQKLERIEAVDTTLSSLSCIQIGAFTYCPNLTSLTIACPTENAAQMSVEYQAIAFNPNLQRLHLANVSAFATTYQSNNTPLEGCGRISCLEIDGLTSIPPYICNSLTSSLKTVKFSDVKNIQNAVFIDCQNLENASFGSQLQNIGASAFYGCRKLSGIEDIEYSSIKSIGSYSFAKTKFQKAEFSALSSVPSYAFDGSEVSSIDMPSLTSISEYAFRGCKLTSVSLPNVIQLNAGAFAGNTLLEAVDMPSLTSIGDGAFEGCTSLTSIYAPLLQDISYKAFKGCEKLKNITGLSNVQTVSQYAFNGCEALVSASFDNARIIEDYAFWNTGLKDVIFQSCLTVLCDEAFNKQILQYNQAADTYTIVGYNTCCPYLSSVWFKDRSYAQISSQIDRRTNYLNAKNVPYWGIPLSNIRLDYKYTSVLKLANGVKLYYLSNNGIVYNTTSIKREVKFLQSTASSDAVRPYINTRILPDLNTKIEIKMAGNSDFFGIMDRYIPIGNIHQFVYRGITSIFIRRYYGQIIFLFNNDYSMDEPLKIFTDNAYEEMTIVLEHGKITIDGIEHTFQTYSHYMPLQKELPLFRVFDTFLNSYTASGSCKIYYFKLWKENQLIQHLVPAIDIEDVPCMYDKVTDQNFYNAYDGQNPEQFTYEEYD